MTGVGHAGMIRQVKVARGTAVNARTSVMTTLKQTVVNVPSSLREDLRPLADRKPLPCCAAFLGPATWTAP